MSIKQRLLIAVDGPAASGKGTLAKRLARHFDLEYLDTGRIYRVVGYKILSMDGDPHDRALAEKIAGKVTMEDIQNEHLYDEGVGNAASIVSAIPEVRKDLLGFQKKVAAIPKGAVLDGRDIGTVVCPEADFKFYITADLETRAARRFKELQDKGNSVIYTTVFEDLKRRDERDSKRDISPLKQADDACHIDTTHMDADTVFQKSLAVIVKKRPHLA